MERRSFGLILFLASTAGAQQKPTPAQKTYTKPQLTNRVKQIVIEQLGVDEKQVSLAASFVDDMGADSLDLVELVMAFEDAFDLEISDKQAQTMKTVSEAISLIERLLRADHRLIEPKTKK